ncbi:MAG: TGS domain-containing protein [Candidatus Eisenbacteria bacterium]|nr:TGS domain-containing protein [Candidatus Eisenbacteria bacterium]
MEDDAVPMSHKDLRVKIKKETKGRTPDQEIAILRGYLADWPEYKGPYQELGKKLSRRVRELERVIAVRGSREVHEDPFSVRKRGLAQVGLVGLPNAGKSTVFCALSGAPAETATYPYTTLVPNVGMMSVGAYEFELVDLPPLSDDQPVSSLSYAAGLKEAVSNAGLLAVVVDLRTDLELVLWVIGERLTELDTRAVWDPAGAAGIGSGEHARPAVLVATRADEADAGSLDELRTRARGALIFAHPFGEGVRSRIGEALCSFVGRIVIKARNPAEPDDPVDYAVPDGATVLDLAETIHKDLAASAERARIWGPSARHEGQEVGLDHVLSPGDTVEVIER